MIREILFKAKRVDNGEWVEGDLIHGIGYKEGNAYILPFVKNLAYCKGCDPLDGYHVIPETVCQYTGLKDKNGNKIWEGDILNVAGDLIPVKYLDGSFHIIALKNQGRSPLIDDRAKRTEVVGNIYDNTDFINKR